MLGCNAINSTNMQWQPFFFINSFTLISFCIFVVHKQFKRNLKLFFYDKELPAMGNNNESVVLPVLDCLCSPKAATPHTYLFSMHKKKEVVVGSQEVTATSFNVANGYTQELHKAIGNFFTVANAHNFQEANTETLNAYLETAISNDGEICYNHVKSVVFLVTAQNKFLTQLKEAWLLHKKFNQPLNELK